MAEATVRQLLAAKGAEVAWITADTSVSQALADLAEHGVGALVVSAEGTTVDGIVSERDIVRALASSGTSGLDEDVGSIMTTEVETCTLDDPVSTLMARMTAGRFRHLPVVTDQRLVGVVSIGDVVKQRVGELEAEAQQLLDFIQAR